MPQPSSPPATPTPKAVPGDSVDALQKALGAEHTAVWVYELVSAFLPASFNNALAQGATTHRAQRDTTERALTASNATPQAAEPAYLTPKPVTDQASSLALLVSVESDAAVAWRSVLENTDDADLRRTALGVLSGSAVRATRWRKSAGASPLAPPMPGQPG
ncbi:ferritin-like domain-containing protein [Actinocrispum wychmicini]|uniref:Uncharacterized protein DUF4439 n=1 Tax=Actinocrispum wychmicini TaxID=1213861 RepID=A0A4R2JIK9_9PSEU|nr:ferritin-like domain-containing protein [Actinocrispum wychmicini]TCO56818.1 uncharacterized protein DUF4439 [Actinocrispum wychmicini]